MQYIQGTSYKKIVSTEVDNFFFIPKGSIIDSSQKGLVDIGDQISKDTERIENEIAEGN